MSTVDRSTRCSAVHGGSGWSFQRPIPRSPPRTRRWNSGVFVAYQSGVSGRDRGPSVGGPPAHCAVIGMVGDAIGPEGHDAIGSEVGDVIGDRSGAVDGGAGAVFEARADAPRARPAPRGSRTARAPATPGEPRWGPRLRVAGAVLAERRCDDTTRSPRCRQRAIRPADRYASSSGWAHTPSSVRGFMSARPLELGDRLDLVGHALTSASKAAG